MASINDQTREFQETPYYRVTFEHQTADLVEPSRFWLDYAKFLLSNEDDHFLSRHFHTPTKNLAQVINYQSKKPCQISDQHSVQKKTNKGKSRGRITLK